MLLSARCTERDKSKLARFSVDAIFLRSFFYNKYFKLLPQLQHGVLKVSALNSGSSGPNSNPGQGYCVVFLGKTLYSHSASLPAGAQVNKWVPMNLMLEVTP